MKSYLDQCFNQARTLKAEFIFGGTVMEVVQVQAVVVDIWNSRILPSRLYCILAD